jgi:hypothetical protein
MAANNIKSDRVIKRVAIGGENEQQTKRANHDNQNLSRPFNREGISRFQKRRHRLVHAGA